MMQWLKHSNGLMKVWVRWVRFDKGVRLRFGVGVRVKFNVEVRVRYQCIRLEEGIGEVSPH